MIAAAAVVTTDPTVLALVALGGALGGAAIGALGSALSAALSSSAATRREAIAYRRETYARVIASSHRVVDSVKVMMGQLSGREEPGRVRRILHPSEAREADRSDQMMASAMETLMAASDELEMLAAMVEAVGSPKVAAAARAVTEETVEWIVRQSTEDVETFGVVKAATITSARERVQAKHDALIVAVRRALK
jgi:hypothetical protein